MDWEYGEFQCPKCNAYPTRFKHCDNIGCDDGYIDMHEFDDPMLFDEGDYERCQECRGMGVIHWCGECGYTLTRKDMRQQEQEEIQ